MNCQIVNVAIYFEGGMDKRLHGKSLVRMRTGSLLNFTKEAVIKPSQTED